MAKLSCGWQIRNPLDLWKYEAELTMRNHLGTGQGQPGLDPITTEPGALYGSDTSLGVTADIPESDIFMAMLTMPNVILDVLVEPERTPKDPLEKWTEHHRKITARIHVQGIPKQQRINLARRRYWNENLAFYTTAYRRLTTSADFPSYSDRELRRMLAASPMVGLLSELFVRRFVDHKIKWSGTTS